MLVFDIISVASLWAFTKVSSLLQHLKPTRKFVVSLIIVAALSVML